MDRLRTTHENIDLYNAGLPGFPRNFTRDSIISGILTKDAHILRNQLTFSGLHQGTKADAQTGEEPGKIFHEFPGYIMPNGLSTEYNACDTTALFLIGLEHYLTLTEDKNFIEANHDRIKAATHYIQSHLIEDIFFENPTMAGADKFALKVTYWKDSELAQRKDGAPSYPVAYFLAHAINLAGVRSASRLLESLELEALAKRMQEKLHQFYDARTNSFAIAIDSLGPVVAVSSDPLHALFYLEQGDLTAEEINGVHIAGAELETRIGYLTLSPKNKSEVADQYHAATVWPFEQAIINLGARKFGLQHIEEVSRRVYDRLDTDNEIFKVVGDSIEKGGCHTQLWTIAAKKYFSLLPVPMLQE
jgi:glycogen debranching enzyme